MAGQLLWWPVLPWVIGERVGLAGTIAVGIGAALVGGGLAWRREAPGPALAVALTVVTMLTAAGLGDEVDVLSLGVVLALFSLARLRTAGVAAGGGAAAAGCLVVAEFIGSGLSVRAVGHGLIALSVCAVVWAYGRGRRRAAARQAAVVSVLERAEEDRVRAQVAERERLTRDLHDVAAHHLSGIVVQAGAARRLAAEDAAAEEALEHAAAVGMETLTSLRRLVEVMGETESGRIDELVAGFRALGMSVDHQSDDALRLPSQIEAALYGIAREALTNALRYAAGGAIRVVLKARENAVELTVRDNGGAKAAPGIGSGRGVAGMRARAAELGGTLTAEPHGGGWLVRAVIPLRTAGTLTAGRSRLSWPRGARVVDWTLALLALALPIGASLLPDDDMREPYARPGPAALLLLVLLLHGAPLIWRRRAPWAVLTVMPAVMLAWVGLDAAELTPPGSLILLQAAWWAQPAAVYAVAVYRRPAVSLPAPLVIAAGAGAGVAVTALTDPDVPWAERPSNALGGGLIFLLIFAVPGVLAWGAGLLVRLRRRRRAASRDARLRAADREAKQAARVERVRVGLGLRDAVLTHTEQLVQAAASTGEPVAERLDTVLAEGRAALAAMRELLADLGAEEEQGEPPPTLRGVRELCGRRGVALVAADAAVPVPVPVEIEVAAYRAVEAMIDGLTEVRIACDRAGLRLELAGAGAPPELAGVRDRLDAVGGTVARTPAGPEGWAVRMWFPEFAEVASSRSRS